MKWLIVLAMCWQAVAFGDEVSVKREQVEKEIDELDKRPVAVEFKAISRKISELQEEQRTKSQPLYEVQQKLGQSDAFKEYLEKRQKLEGDREEAWQAERKAIAEAARAIYSARHAEIKAVASPDLKEAAKLGFDVLTYPRVDGSTSTGPLSVMMACRILGVPYEWNYPEPTGYPWQRASDLREFYLPASAEYQPRDYEFMLATLKVIAKPATRQQERIAVMINSLLAISSTTHDAYVNLISGKCDVNLTARPPSESERKLALEKGVTIKLEPIARDAFVFMVHKTNTVKTLTRQQVKDIYEERLTNWPAVGAAGDKILAFRRERDSGSRELFDALVLPGKVLTEEEERRLRPLYANSMGGPFSQLTRQAGGLGYSIYYYEHFMAASPYTRTVPIDGVEPTPQTIASGEYPWVTDVYAAYRDGESADSPGMKLVRWLASAEGQAMVRESGYIPAKKGVANAQAHRFD
jgi:phosphate transport system substrate-binding protein